MKEQGISPAFFVSLFYKARHPEEAILSLFYKARHPEEAILSPT